MAQEYEIGDVIEIYFRISPVCDNGELLEAGKHIGTIIEVNMYNVKAKLNCGNTCIVFKDEIRRIIRGKLVQVLYI